jgi:anti-sigma factor RsiW
MTCDDSRTYLPAYLDDELDVAESLRMQKHLAACADSRQVQEEQLALRSALRDPGLYAHPSRDLAKRVQGAVQRVAKEQARSPWLELLRFESLRWVPAAAALVVVATIGGLLVISSLRSSHQQLTASGVVTAHIRSLQAVTLSMCLPRIATP